MNRIVYVWSSVLFLPGALSAGDWGSKQVHEGPGGRLDKSQYTLFHPTPDEQMRDFSTDRPDATESPITVDAGHYQVEVSFFDFSYDRSGGEKSEVWTYGSFNWKAGLLHHVDLQLVLDSFVTETVTQGGVRSTVSGLGDLQARLKINLWGNEGDPTALGLMPYVKIPTGTAVSNGHWEGGLIIPFSWTLSDRVGIGLMAEADFVYDEVSGGYETECGAHGRCGVGAVRQMGRFRRVCGGGG